jgi:DNA/RNA endonuclease YhcR with UshA esterase domain
MKVNFYEGENVRHKAKAEWGIGKIVVVDTCGTIKVIFEGTREVSIAKGMKYLIKVDKNGNKIVPLKESSTLTQEI